MSQDYPEHEKLKALNGVNNVVGQFIEWLISEGYVIAQWSDVEEVLYPSPHSTEALIGGFFDIDPLRLDEEKRQMLDSIREQQQ